MSIMDHTPISNHMVLKDKYFFLHIPKTAGTSLKMLLMEQFHKDDIFPAQTNEQMAKIEADDIPNYKLFIGHHGYQFIDHFAPFRPQLITMLRDPINRVISDYYFARQRPDRDPIILECPTFEAYLSHPHIQNRIFNNQSQHLLGVGYNDFLELDFDDCYDTITQRLDDMEFVGITERFPESLLLLAHTFDWNISKEIRRNVSVNRSDIEEIDTQLIDVVRQKNELDYRVYDYARNLFERRLKNMTQIVVQGLLHKRYLAQLAVNDTYTIDLTTDVLLGEGWGVRLPRGRDLPINTDIRFHLALQKSSDLSIRLSVFYVIPEILLEHLILRLNGEDIPLELKKRVGIGWDYIGVIPVGFIRDNDVTEFHLRLNYSDLCDGEDCTISLRRIFIEPVDRPTSLQSDIHALDDLRLKFVELQQQHVLEDTYFFLHIHKTAGTSLKTLLDSKFHKDEVFPPKRYPELEAFPKEQITNYKMYSGHHSWEFIHHFYPSRPQLITLLRNPINRIISKYYFNQYGVGKDSRIEECPTLLDYVNHAYFRTFTHNFQSQIIMGQDYDQLTQLSFSEQVEIVTQRLSQFEFVGITERFADSILLLDHIFGWMPSEEVRRNVGSIRPKVEDYDKDVIDTIRFKNQLDFAVYEFATKLFDERFREMSRLVVRSYNHSRYLSQIDTYSESIEFYFHSDVVYGTGWIVKSPRGREIPVNTDVQVYLPVKPSSDLLLRLHVVKPDPESLLDSLGLRINDQPIPLELVNKQGTIWVMQATIPVALISDNQPTCFHIRVNMPQSDTQYDDIKLSIRRINLTPIIKQ